MLALRKLKDKGGLHLVDVQKPVAQSGQVVVQVRAAGICGSDIHISESSQAYRFVNDAAPVTVGHEFSGIVSEVGPKVEGLSEGDRIVVMPSQVCEQCPACSDGQYDSCIDRKGTGMTRDGAFAEYVAVPAINCLALPESLSFEIAALIEPLSVSLEAITRGGEMAGARVLVMGPGTIGQGIAVLARMQGARQVVVTGMNDAVRFKTLQELGFDELIDVARPDAASKLVAAAKGGFDFVLEATGATDSISSGIDLLANGGTLVITGIHQDMPPINATAMVRRNLSIRGSYRSLRSAWPQLIDIIADDPLRFAPMITHRYRLEDALYGFEAMKQRLSSKAIITPHDRQLDR